jgi:hypothetical protein
MFAVLPHPNTSCFARVNTLAQAANSREEAGVKEWKIDHD